jgi:hypothetical protein
MPAITPEFLFNFESRMRLITEAEYLRMTSSEAIWWDKVTRVIPSGAGREIFSWVLNTAQIEKQGKGGNVEFEDMVTKTAEYTVEQAGKGLRLEKNQFKDLDGNGIQLGTEWAAQMGAQHGYWPQSQIADLLKNGHTRLGYDGKNFFATDHPNNGIDADAGTFKNLHVAPIDESVTAEVAVKNLGGVYASIGSMKMPNGVTPRFLRPKGILCSPTLMLRASQITDAKFIAMSAGSGGGSGDLAGVIKKLGFGEAIQADELAGFESGTTYFVICEQVAASQLGAFAYVDRESFTIRYYTGAGGGGGGLDSLLDRTNTLEWLTSGRNVSGYGHPYLIHKVTAA